MMRIRAAATVIAAMLTVAGGTWAVVKPSPPWSDDSTPGNGFAGLPLPGKSASWCRDQDDLGNDHCTYKEKRCEKNGVPLKMWQFCDRVCKDGSLEVTRWIETNTPCPTS